MSLVDHFYGKLSDLQECASADFHGGLVSISVSKEVMDAIRQDFLRRSPFNYEGTPSELRFNGVLIEEAS